MDSPQTEHVDKGRARSETRHSSQCRSASPRPNDLDIDHEQHSPSVPYVPCNGDMNERSAYPHRPSDTYHGRRYRPRTPPRTDSYTPYSARSRDPRSPVTCFFWYHTGECRKPDDECRYAHYNTGVVAEAPIGYNQYRRIIRGVNQREDDHDMRTRDISDAQHRLDTRARDVEDSQHRLDAAQASLRERERAIIAREEALKKREDAFSMFEEDLLRKLETDYHNIVDVIKQISRALNNAQHTLGNRREQVLHYENFIDYPQSGPTGLGRYGGSIAIDGAIGAMGGLDRMLSETEDTLTFRIRQAIHNR